MTNAELKDIINRIVLAQGNSFIKELLRDNSITIGTNKREFAENLCQAVDKGDLTEEMIEVWLSEVEGWGNQHLYTFEKPDITGDEAQTLLRASDKADMIGRAPSYEFPEEYLLSGIELNDESLMLLWQIGKQSWPRARSHDFRDERGGDIFKFEAYRLHQERSAIRFIWKFDSDYCAILIHRNRDIDHSDAQAVVWELLKDLGLSDHPRPRLLLTEAVKSASRQDGAKQTRMEVDGGYIELKSTLAEGGINQVEAVRHARHAVNDAAFTRAQGLFSVDRGEDGDSPTTVEVAGEEGRIRIWAQCKRDFVEFVVDRFVDLNRVN